MKHISLILVVFSIYTSLKIYGSFDLSQAIKEEKEALDNKYQRASKNLRDNEEAGNLKDVFKEMEIFSQKLPSGNREEYEKLIQYRKKFCGYIIAFSK